MLVTCDPVADPIEFQDASEVLDILGEVTRGWSLRTVAAKHADAPGRPWLRIDRSRGRLRIHERGEASFNSGSAVSTACTVIKIVLNRMANQRAGAVCLHAGAVMLGGKAILFPCTHRSGKSTLVSAMAFAGHAAIADDILPIVEENGHTVCEAPGVAPRLRLPLPADIGAEFVRNARRMAGPGDWAYRYLRLPRDVLANRGRTAPVGALVFLDRDPRHGVCKLEPIRAADAIHAMIAQSFGAAEPPRAKIDRIANLAGETPAFLMRYASATSARRLLEEAFGPVPSVDTREREPLARSLLLQPFEATGSPGALDSNLRLAPRPGVEQHDRNGLRFLIDPDSEAIFSIDPLGEAIWALVGDGMTSAEIIDLITEAFPATDRARITADTSRFLAELARRGLAQPIEALQPSAHGARTLP
jgi:hypothetical protein